MPTWETFTSFLLNSFWRSTIKIMVKNEFIKYKSRRILHTWYSLISDLSKPGMKRVTNFLFISNLTDDVTSLHWFARKLRRCLASSLAVSSRTLLQSIGLFIDKLEMKAEGKGEKSFLALSDDSRFCCREVIPKAPETWAPAWIVQPQYRNAELTEVGLLGSITRKQLNLCGFENAEDPLWAAQNQYRTLWFALRYGMITFNNIYSYLQQLIQSVPYFWTRSPIEIRSAATYFHGLLHKP